MRYRRHRISYRGKVVLSGALLITAVAAPSAKTIARVTPPHATSTSHAASTAMGQFNGVACYDFNACVAVGNSRPDERATDRQLAASWNGRRWTALPAPAYRWSRLNSADCVSALCLLAGQRQDSAGAFTPLAETWDKGRKITDTMAPHPAGSTSARLNAVSCLSATYCIAVGGMMTADGVYAPLAMRFDGSSGRSHPRPRWRRPAAPWPASPASPNASCPPPGATPWAGTRRDRAGALRSHFRGTDRPGPASKQGTRTRPRATSSGR